MTVIRRRRHTRLRRGALWITLAYLVLLTLIAFWPTPVDRGMHGSIGAFVTWLHAHGMPNRFGYDTIEFTANIALFIPVGLLVVVLAGARRWWLGPVAGAIISAMIELGQLVLLPERFATVNDVIANSLGALFGTVLALIVLRFTLGPHPTPRPIRLR
ncbi:VanZ family protein [Cryobacterium sp. PH31-L1]|uniref:VanZ family protein n=1 Tax=Cryobacterium sp. PH31-L1 TaxID=3046199 RepID=UPI0024B8B4E5|nr:VanZ family protein [Cryobacterium sp. PH31-L1]MDJ0376234.1 VanZ family protein [Cryobacterium sp. PH31-L1]